MAYDITRDSAFGPYKGVWEARTEHIRERRMSLCGSKPQSLKAFADWHLHYGLHLREGRVEFRESLPNATAVWLVGDFSAWERLDKYRLYPEGNGDWSGSWDVGDIPCGCLYRMHVVWPGGEGDRLPSAVRELHRSSDDLSRGDVVFHGVVPDWGRRYVWRRSRPPKPSQQLVYEAHVGMAQEELKVGTFREFTEKVLPRIATAGYNTLQLMAIMAHPYYASFGYQVSNFFAVCDLFGSPEDFKVLVDAAHGLGLRVTIDLVHSHSSPNTLEGLAELDGSGEQFFHVGGRGRHPGWGTLCFDYSRRQTLRLLLSSCRFWLEEYHLDGFRFDGVTSMLYLDHGLGHCNWLYGDYFSMNVDWDALAYMSIANELIHFIRPDSTTIAEEVSGFPALTVPYPLGGGFDYRLAMGVTDYWFKLGDIRDEDWSMHSLWQELTAHRPEERCISYVESHDQALVGGQTFIFRLAGTQMYNGMAYSDSNLATDRAVALHKMARLVTFATASGGYLNFMGNEFGHTDWVDFPSGRNGWSFEHARRLWHLRDDRFLKFGCLADFDIAMLKLCEEGKWLQSPPVPMLLDEERKLLVFERGNRIFAFNFNCANSYESLELLVMPGTYKLLLDTDALGFGGFGRVEPDQRYFSRPRLDGNTMNNYISIYLPARTGLVLERKKC